MEAKYTSPIEEIANSITHGLGLLIVIIAVFFLLLINNKTWEFWRMLGISIFGLSVILTYTFSTLYHSLYFTKANPVFKRLDHSSIFLLITGTYTPFLIFIRSKEGFILLSILWLITVLGIIYKSIFIDKLKRVELLVYLFLGWIGIFILSSILNTMPILVILLLIAGGCFYTFGAIFYAWKKLKFNHGIWHLFVLFGTACHFLALLRI